MIDGFFLIDKQAGMTSHDVVSAVRRIAGQKKVGHTGTLDPFATGVLPVALGEGTKAIQFLDEAFKEYQAVMMLGVATDSQDCTGKVIETAEWRHVTPDAVVDVCTSFLGRQSQMPPMFSALKRNGVPLYKLARQGADVDRETRDIEIASCAVDWVKLPEVAFTVRCSRGTYVRTLARDMGHALGCGAHLVQLRRIKSGPFFINDAVTLDTLSQRFKTGFDSLGLVSPFTALSHLKNFILSDRGAAKVRQGISPRLDDFLFTPDTYPAHNELVRFSISGENLVAVAEVVFSGGEEDQLHFKLARVFNLVNSFTDQRLCDNDIRL